MATSTEPGPRKRARASGAGKESGQDAALRLELEHQGLSPYEAKVLLALLRLGTATIPQLNQICDVPRANVYGVLEALGDMRVAERLPNQRPMLWTTPGREAVLDRLNAIAEDRLREHKERTERVRSMLVEAIPESLGGTLPYANLIRSPRHVERTYNEMLRAAEREVLMFTKPPYTSTKVNPVVAETLARGVTARVIYEMETVQEPECQEWLDAYDAAGVQARTCDHLALKLVIVDRKSLLIGLRDPDEPDTGYPATLHIDHPGYAELHVVGFEKAWAAARPYTRRALEAASASADAYSVPGSSRSKLKKVSSISPTASGAPAK